MQWFISFVAGIAVTLAWAAIWAFLLHIFGIAAFSRWAKDRAGRRDRIKKMGKPRYILIFGILGFGLAFGLGMTASDLLDHSSHSWLEISAKLVFLSLLLGWFQGARTWSEAFRDPIPFPPKYGTPE